jgi:hypothetical protein
MNGITTPGGWFMTLPDDKHVTSPNDQRNWFLYRSNNAASYFFGNFKNRKIVYCYFYHKGENGRMTDWKDTQIKTYIGFWPWKNIIECNDVSHKILTQLFYDNMEFIDEPWGFTILVCKQPIVVTIPQLVKWFSTLDTGEQIYAYRKWPEITEGTIREYKRWFVPRLINDREIFATSLPVVHRLAFHFINNILTAKATFKTNMKINFIFYLRHLLSMNR